MKANKLSECNSCHFFQAQDCVAGKTKRRQQFSRLGCSHKIRSYPGVTENRDYLSILAIRHSNRVGWTISVLSLAIAALTLFIRVLEVESSTQKSPDKSQSQPSSIGVQ